MWLQKKPVETAVTNNYAETTSTEVKLRLKPAIFFVNYVKMTVHCGNFFLSATVPYNIDCIILIKRLSLIKLTITIHMCDRLCENRTCWGINENEIYPKIGGKRKFMDLLIINSPVSLDIVLSIHKFQRF